jgi:hypothetical protein
MAARKMSSKSPEVRGQQLYLPTSLEPVCSVDSNAWFVWLETAVAFRYHSQARVVMIRGQGPQASPISLRQEQRRRGALWYAYKRNHGVLHKRYVGKSAALTSVRLDEVAVELSRVW